MSTVFNWIPLVVGAAMIAGCSALSEPSQSLELHSENNTAQQIRPTSKIQRPTTRVIRNKATGSRSRAPVIVGEASWYGPGFHGRTTANGEVFDKEKLTAAHKTLPLGSRAKVTNLTNEKSVEVEINDRGPYIDGRIIDLSQAAARALGMIDQGTARVQVEVLKD